MGFNIGMDDDDKFGPGPNGDMSRSQDLELQYFWANRTRFLGWTAAEDALGIYSEEDIATSFEELGKGNLDTELGGFYETVLNPQGRLSHGGAGEIIFGPLVETGCVVPSDGVPGDFNGSGEVDVRDFLLLSRNFNGMDVGYENGDFDCSGTVDVQDFLGLSRNWGRTEAANVAAVPEPATGSLFVFCAAALVALSRRRRQ